MKKYNELLKGAKSVHFLGIGGVGLSATAKLLQDQGYRVSGSDANAHPPVTTYLEANNIPYTNSFSPKNIPEDTDLVVIGMSRNLKMGSNEEIKEVYKRKIPVVQFPHILSALTKNTDNLVCVGSYGKSSCAALAAFALSFAGKDPSFFIGAIPHNLETSSKIGSGKTFVLEGDEYPTFFDDLSPKFLHYNPCVVLVTSMIQDHLDVYPTQTSFSDSFIQLAQQLPSDGLAVVNTDQDETRPFIDALPCRFVGYGLNNTTMWHAKNIEHGEQTTFSLMYGDKELGKGSTPLLGVHNIENIVGVGALLIERELLSVEEYLAAVCEFRGVKRRLDKVTNSSRIPLYEGFGSSHEKVRAAISAMRSHHKGRLLVLFEPHAISWKHTLYRKKYATLFDDVNQVFIYDSSSPDDESKGLTIEEIIQHISQPVRLLNEPSDIKVIQKNLKEGDCILALSSGNFGGMVKELALWLDSEYAAVSE